jgi:hypothetical protein
LMNISGTAWIVVSSSGATIFKRVQFTGTSAQVAASWSPLSQTSPAVYVLCGDPVTDDVRSIEVEVIQSSVTPTGCTVQSNVPDWVGYVILTIILQAVVQ